MENLWNKLKQGQKQQGALWVMNVVIVILLFLKILLSCVYKFIYVILWRITSFSSSLVSQGILYNPFGTLFSFSYFSFLELLHQSPLMFS